MKRALLIGLLACFLPLHSTAHALEKVTFASVKLGTIGFITHIAKVNKLDEQNGLDLDLKFFTPTEGINAFLFKKVDAGYVGIIPALRANARGSRVRLLAPMLTSHFGIITTADVPYRTVDDLRGKKVGTLPRVSGVYSSLALVARMRGIDIEKDFRLVLGAPQVLQGLLQKRELDAVVQFDQNTIRLMAAGTFREMLTLEDLWKEVTGADYLLSVALAAHEEWIRASPDRARRLAWTITAAIREIRTHPLQAVEVSREVLGYANDREKQLAARRLPPMYPNQWNEKTLHNTRLAIRKSAEYGLLEPEALGHLEELLSQMPRELSFQ